VFCYSANILRERVQCIKYMYRKLAGGGFVKVKRRIRPQRLLDEIYPRFHKASEVLNQISWLLSYSRRVRIFLNGRSLDGCPTPGADQKMRHVDKPGRNRISPRVFMLNARRRSLPSPEGL
jgi:hypothetical protein